MKVFLASFLSYFITTVLPVTALPVDESFPTTEVPDGVTTTSSEKSATLDVKIHKATEKIRILNQKVEDSLAQSIIVDATESPTDIDEGILNYAAISSSSEAASSRNISSEAAEREQKFSDVLKELADLESVIEDGIRNFTANRQWAYSSMLRPMLLQIQQLRTNLAGLRNRMIGFVALAELQLQVHNLTQEMGDIVTGSRPSLSNVLDEEGELDLKPMRDSLDWIAD